MILRFTSIPAEGEPVMPGDCAIASDCIREVVQDKLRFRGVMAPIASIYTVSGKFVVFDTGVIERWATATGEHIDDEDTDWITRKLS